jgi:thiamine biosynthesis lipoprotein
VHTINPKTGYTEQNSLLSVSVFTKSCAEADAYATAFMAMGIQRALPLAESLKDLQVYFIYADSANNLQEKYVNGAEQLFLK